MYEKGKELQRKNGDQRQGIRHLKVSWIAKEKPLNVVVQFSLS